MNANRRVEFVSPPLAKMAAADRKWGRYCRMIDVSDIGAQLEIAGPEQVMDEFFLLLSTIGQPAFRRCKVIWIKGVRLGVTFEKSKLSAKLLEESPPTWDGN
jgi:hypothetical protein